MTRTNRRPDPIPRRPIHAFLNRSRAIRAGLGGVWAQTAAELRGLGDRGVATKRAGK